jgi:hypothetical protein
MKVYCWQVGDTGFSRGLLTFSSNRKLFLTGAFAVGCVTQATLLPAKHTKVRENTRKRGAGLDRADWD